MSNTTIPLKNRTLYIHPMTRAGARMMAAVFRSVGIDSMVTPPSDTRTLELGNMYSSGEECLPEKITLGDYLKITETEGFDPAKTAFLMPSANGPCRFGQYCQLLRAVLNKLGMNEVMIVSPSSKDSYGEIGKVSKDFYRNAFTGLLAADILRKLLLKTRPYENVKGTTDTVYEQNLERVERLLEIGGLSFKKRFALLCDVLTASREDFRAIDADYIKGKPLIGVLGEIFCRHNRFANEDMIRKLEKNGAETWIADVGEWVFYTDWSSRNTMKRLGKKYSLQMAVSLIKNHFMKQYEHQLLKPFHDDFVGYEEPADTEIVAQFAEPYLPLKGAHGEMALSLGRAGYLYTKGVDGLVDISPFACMNGIVSEAVYPSFSEDHHGIPCRVFFYDGINLDLDQDIGIFMELVKGFMSRKKEERRYPAVFH